MTTHAHNVEYTYRDYLLLEAIGDTKHEYLAGQIYAMAGGTPEHAALAATVTALLFPQLRAGRCRVHDSDLRVRVQATGLVAELGAIGARLNVSELYDAVAQPRS